MTAEAEATSRQMGVLFVDIDDFKAVNDTFGHKYGDQILIEIVDDGKGMRADFIRQKAIEKGLISPGDAGARSVRWTRPSASVTGSPAHCAGPVRPRSTRLAPTARGSTTITGAAPLRTCFSSASVPQRVTRSSR